MRLRKRDVRFCPNLLCTHPLICAFQRKIKHTCIISKQQDKIPTNKTSPQAKRHKPSLLFHFFYHKITFIIGSLLSLDNFYHCITFITRYYMYSYSKLNFKTIFFTFFDLRTPNFAKLDIYVFAFSASKIDPKKSAKIKK